MTLTVGAVVSAAATRLTGADNGTVDVSATACRAPSAPAALRTPATVGSTGWPVCARSARSVGASLTKACCDCRRHPASTANRAGDSIGATGLSVSDELKPAHANTVDTASAPAGSAAACGAKACAGTAGGGGTARWTAASATTDPLGGPACGDEGASLVTADGCPATPTGTAVVFTDDRFGFLRGAADSCDNPPARTGVGSVRAVVSWAVVFGSAVTVSGAVPRSGPTASPAEESPRVALLFDVESGVDADPEVTLDVVESDVDADPRPVRDVVESDVDVGPEVVCDVESGVDADPEPLGDVESGAEGDPDFLFDVESGVDIDPELLFDVESELDIDSEVLREVVESRVDADPEPLCDDASGVDPDRDESGESTDPPSGPACATPGVVATANPTPNATANAPTRPMYFA